MARGPLAGPAGPGKFSTRTDGLSFQPQEYGQGVEMSAIKAGAPLANTPDVRGATNTEVRQAVGQVMPPKVTPLFASTVVLTGINYTSPQFQERQQQINNQQVTMNNLQQTLTQLNHHQNQVLQLHQQYLTAANKQPAGNHE